MVRVKPLYFPLFARCSNRVNLLPFKLPLIAFFTRSRQEKKWALERCSSARLKARSNLKPRASANCSSNLVRLTSARKRKLLEQSRSFDFRAPRKQYECACDKGEPNQWIVQRNPKKLFPHRFALSSSVVPSVTKYCTRLKYKERCSRSRGALCLRGTSCPLWLK
jgi:hypothetical protein